MNKKFNSDYWLTFFYVGMALLTAILSALHKDFSWLLLAVGSSFLGLSSRLSITSNKTEQADKPSNKSEVFSRVGFLFLASGLLMNAFA